MNGVSGHVCAHYMLTGPGELPEDGEMNAMTGFEIRGWSPKMTSLIRPTASFQAIYVFMYTNKKKCNIIILAGTWHHVCDIHTRPAHKILMIVIFTKYVVLFTYNYFYHSIISIYKDRHEVTYFNQLFIEYISCL